MHHTNCHYRICSSHASLITSSHCVSFTAHWPSYCHILHVPDTSFHYMTGSASPVVRDIVDDDNLSTSTHFIEQLSVSSRSSTTPVACLSHQLDDISQKHHYGDHNALSWAYYRSSRWLTTLLELLQPDLARFNVSPWSRLFRLRWIRYTAAETDSVPC